MNRGNRDAMGQSASGPAAGPQGSVRSGVTVMLDLAFVTVVVFLTLWFAATYGRQGGPLLVRVPVGFLFVFFLPGYAITSALFPRRDAGTDTFNPPAVSVTPTERLVLSLGLSITGVPLVSLLLIFLSQPIELLSVLGSLAALTLGGVAVAAVRRFMAPPGERFHVPLGSSVTTGIEYATTNALNFALVVVLALAVASAGFVLASSSGEERYTELALLGPGSGDGPEVGNHSGEFELGEPETLYVEIANNERQDVEYTGVVLLQNLTAAGNDTVVTETDELDRFTVGLAHDQRTVFEHSVRPTFAGENVRLTYLLYRGEPPEEPRPANAYRSVHITIDVTG